MAEQQEQNRSEAPTPFKLQRAREKGMVARSAELGFLGSLIALAGFGAVAGPGVVQQVAQLMRVSFSAGIDRAGDPREAQAMLGELAQTALAPLALLGFTIVAVVLFLEILQLRGLIFTAQPLKPDFTRLNPATGLKRLFSMRMLKETLKTVLKSAIYGVAAWLVLQDSVARFASAASDGERLAGALAGAGLRLLFVFIAIAICFVILDQLLVRGEFLKQMRMSRREVTREARDREGDPRIKQKRKQLHGEFVKQSQGVGDLPGSDVLVVNPEHFAVALRYDADSMSAPIASAKGRNRFALALKQEAYRLGIPIIERPPLARALYRACQPGKQIPASTFEAVAEIYVELRRSDIAKGNQLMLRKLALFRDQKDLVLVAATIAILVILFVPIPPALLDLAIIVNFGFGLTIMLLTFYVGKPTEFSTFPSLLLIATLYRLSLNVAATRLILTGGDAGEVIGSIGAFAVQGNFVIGLVVFSILVVVQYVVVTSGAQRVSEVAARFTLDSMPGQQMSIDADLNMGLIEQKEAIRRRKELEKEASFYGAMDGASKFVKGDAIAGIIILLINIIAGWIVGVSQMGMEWSEALAHFTLLTIGDGIATQLPALIISIATGIIVTRSAADKQLSTEVFRQLASEPRIALIVTAVLLALMLMPGMPKWPIVLIAGFAAFGWWRSRKREAAESDLAQTEIEASAASIAPPAALEIRLGADLGEAWRQEEAIILDRVATARKAQEQELGFGFPAVKLVDGQGLAGFAYEIRLFGARYGSAEIRPERVLAIAGQGSRGKLDGDETIDPAFGIPAYWIEETGAPAAKAAGYTIVDPVTLMLTHFGEIVRSEASTLLTRATVATMLNDVRERQPGMVEELIPNMLTLSDVQRVLQNLLGEGVSIANLDLIVEHLVDLARAQKDPAELTELVRQRLSYAICHQLRGVHSDLAVLSLDPRVENQLAASINASAGRGAMVVEPRLADQLLRKLAPMTEDMFRQGRAPVLLCGGEVRRHLRGLTRRSIPKLSVLSVSEIPMRVSLTSFDIVRPEA